MHHAQEKERLPVQVVRKAYISLCAGAAVDNLISLGDWVRITYTGKTEDGRVVMHSSHGAADELFGSVVSRKGKVHLFVLSSEFFLSEKALKCAAL
jgi:hypothetical protein